MHHSVTQHESARELRTKGKRSEVSSEFTLHPRPLSFSSAEELHIQLGHPALGNKYVCYTPRNNSESTDEKEMDRSAQLKAQILSLSQEVIESVLEDEADDFEWSDDLLSAAADLRGREEGQDEAVVEGGEAVVESGEAVEEGGGAVEEGGGAVEEGGGAVEEGGGAVDWGEKAAAETYMGTQKGDGGKGEGEQTNRACDQMPNDPDTEIRGAEHEQRNSDTQAVSEPSSSMGLSQNNELDATPNLTADKDSEEGTEENASRAAEDERSNDGSAESNPRRFRGERKKKKKKKGKHTAPRQIDKNKGTQYKVMGRLPDPITLESLKDRFPWISNADATQLEAPRDKTAAGDRKHKLIQRTDAAPRNDGPVRDIEDDAESETDPETAERPGRRPKRFDREREVSDTVEDQVEYDGEDEEDEFDGDSGSEEEEESPNPDDEEADNNGIIKDEESEDGTYHEESGESSNGGSGGGSDRYAGSHDAGDHDAGDHDTSSQDTSSNDTSNEEESADEDLEIMDSDTQFTRPREKRKADDDTTTMGGRGGKRRYM